MCMAVCVYMCMCLFMHVHVCVAYTTCVCVHAYKNIYGSIFVYGISISPYAVSLKPVGERTSHNCL